MLNWFSQLNFFQQLALICGAAINIAAFFYVGLDKLKAQLAHRRIKEMTLWILALIGGSPGILLGMRFFRHKTRKLSFQAGLAMILAAQVLIGYFLFF